MRLFILLLLPFWLFAEAKPKVLFVNAFHFSKVKLHHVSTVLEEQNISFTYKNVSALKNEDNLTSFFKPYDFVIFDAISSSTSKKVFEKYSDILQTMDRQFMTLKVLEEKSDFRNKVSFEVHQQIYDYLDNGGLENFKRFSQFLAHDIFGVSDQSAKKAIIYPKTAIYHPKSKEKFFTTLEDYFTFLDSNITGKPIIALSVYRDTIASIDTALIDATIARLESKGAVAVAFYYAKHKSEIPYKALLSHNGKFMPDALVNFKVMHQASKRRAEFETLEIPVFGALVYRNGDQKAYEEDPNGINIMSMPFYLSIPEAAGVINPMMIAAVDENSAEKRVIDYQLDSFVQRILNYTNLQAKPKAEKKAAFFFWNYPSGQNAMGASFLNVPESLAKTFSAMKKEGYSVDEVNASFFTDRIKDMMALYYRDVNASQLVSRDLCELYPLEKYLSWFNALPQKTQDEINNVWGDANSSSMLITQNGKRYFTIPRMKVKNMIVLPQGSRAENKSQEGKSYHDMATPVSHGYLAVYHYVKSVFGVDAIVHVGTHGSQEWLKGKDRGLSLYDSPNLAVGDIPVIYPYIVDDVGEAMQTKRRGSAVVLSHLTPPFSPAGLHDELVVVHELMHQYSEMTEGITKEKTKEEIVKMSKKLSFDKEVSIDSSDFDTFIEVLHDYMDEIAQENQPLGLHTYGE
nr:cobaltochelatase subunit CobN [Campylobacterota bacterium]